MFGSEFFFIIIVAFLLFGSKNLPDVVRGYAKILATLKNATNEIKNEIQKSVDVKDINASIKNITGNFTQEVDDVKTSVASSTANFGKNILEEIPTNITQIKEEVEDVTGPIKRQM
ncbi:twin-arginine translocase TatA/TatE family subunit [Flavobacterium sp.]|jgi:sec-independent protein translocase protein TatA|uniref:twin-arginine translocase TatA/TatE family subunit n=1 Tax=Flavobacterium sp. TaxID=239 RepID=UPI0037C0851C